MTVEHIEAVRSEEYAEDIEFMQDLGKLCLLDEDAVRDYFIEGGTVKSPENSVRKWLHKNVTSQNFRKKLDEGLTARFSELRDLYAFFSTHASLSDATAALLGGLDVPAIEQPFYAKWLAPLWELSRRKPPDGDRQSSELGTPEHARRHFCSWLQARLPPLGWGVGMAWEDANHLFVPRKPTAVLRVFCLGGISETSLSFQSYVVHAPQWLEVRPIELPGHGYREGHGEAVMGRGAMPNGGAPPDAPVDAAAVRAARARLVAQLAEEIEPLLDRPYSLFGFSLGALLAYLLARALIARGHAPPISLVVAGRGAPNGTLAPPPMRWSLDDAALLEQMSQDDDGVLDGVTRTGFDVRGVTANLVARKPEVAARWRLGNAFALLTDTEGSDTELLCPLATIWSDADEIWSPGRETMAGWQSVVKAPSPRRDYMIEGVSHWELVPSDQLRATLFTALAEAVADHVAST